MFMYEMYKAYNENYLKSKLIMYQFNWLVNSFIDVYGNIIMKLLLI